MKKRLIDANRIPYHKSGFPKGDGFDSGKDWAFREDVDKLPTVDAVEVVWCRDCKQFGECSIYDIGNFNRYDFCSYGERKVNET